MHERSNVTEISKRPFFPGPLPAFGDKRRRRVGILGDPLIPPTRDIAILAYKLYGVYTLMKSGGLCHHKIPLKEEKNAPLHLRVEKARRVSCHPKIRVSDLEEKLPTHFTSETIKILKRRYPYVCFIWLMGADNMTQIPRWFQWREIFYQVPIAVLDRGDYAGIALSGKAARMFASYRILGRNASKAVEGPPPLWTFLRIRRHSASSTALRAQRIKEGMSEHPQPKSS